MFKTKNFQIVELVIGANITGSNADIFFQQQPQLQSFNLPGQKVFIKAIETYTDNGLTNSPVTSGYPIATAADIRNATITIVENSTETKKQIPLCDLVKAWPGTASQAQQYQPIFQLKNLWTTDWTKCYVTTVDTPPTTPPFSYLFGVHYDYQPDIEDVRLEREMEELELVRLQRLAMERQLQNS